MKQPKSARDIAELYKKIFPVVILPKGAADLEENTLAFVEATNCRTLAEYYSENPESKRQLKGLSRKRQIERVVAYEKYILERELGKTCRCEMGVA